MIGFVELIKTLEMLGSCFMFSLVEFVSGWILIGIICTWSDNFSDRIAIGGWDVDLLLTFLFFDKSSDVPASETLQWSCISSLVSLHIWSDILMMTTMILALTVFPHHWSAYQPLAKLPCGSDHIERVLQRCSQSCLLHQIIGGAAENQNVSERWVGVSSYQNIMNYLVKKERILMIHNFYFIINNLLCFGINRVNVWVRL